MSKWVNKEVFDGQEWYHSLLEKTSSTDALDFSEKRHASYRNSETNVLKWKYLIFKSSKSKSDRVSLSVKTETSKPLSVLVDSSFWTVKISESAQLA